MSGHPDGDTFLAEVPTFASFAQIADTSLYRPVPQDWTIGLADVVQSTTAIEAGRYKAVNMAGAAVISAVSNALGHGRFPFVFGGDGASFAVPPGWAEAAERALAATATFVREEMALELRIAAVPVAAIRAAGRDLTLARFQVSPHVAYAMFAGGGLAWAEDEMKRGRFALPAAPAGSRPDLAGLSCRFDEIPARRGVILSVIVRPAAGGGAGPYRDLLTEVVGLVEASQDMARPVPEAGPPLVWSRAGRDFEARASRKPGQGLGGRRLRLAVGHAISSAILRYRIPIGGFDPARYLAELVVNSDYRKYDDGLRMTIDCAPELADRVEARLVRAAAEGVAVYGLHRQKAALMTCFTPSPTESNHLHFIDGAAGGYAAAASSLKMGEAS
ncbi:DUF3095 domain-containing protein [Enterovirga sp.]|uniref:DUF3095 domain-containing protein n=1 Tax=Enterovirga sp. TaxID=2026350 RepID=UPI0026080AC9|nr:DUF3095 domain-containing protein [Enterovirga sp.]MDB5590064.1 hypothetical protein [Enterovirga sp.]